MSELKRAFTPLMEVKKSTALSITILHLCILVGVWAFLVPKHTFFPNFGEVLAAWGTLWQNGLFYHIMATLKLCGTATVISIVISCVIAYAATIPFFKPISYFFTRLRYNPIQGFTLFFTIATGGGENLQVTLLVVFMSFYFITALVSIIREIPEEDFIRRKTQKMGQWKILWKVVILDRIDYLVEVIRVNLSITFMMIVSVEAMYKAKGGLGALLVDTTRAYNFPKIFALQLTILAIGILLDMALKAIFRSFPSNKKNR